MSDYRSGEVINLVFEEVTGATGLVDGDFTKEIYRNGVEVSGTSFPFIASIAGAKYRLEFTPPSDGTYEIRVYRTATTWAKYTERIRVRQALTSDVIESQGSVSMAQILQALLSVCAGITEDGGLTFKTPNGLATRVTAEANSSNERTLITLSFT